MTLRFLLQREGDVPPDEAWLSEAERQRVAGLQFPRRRRDFRLGRWTAKRAIAACLGLCDIGAERIEIRAAPSGAPAAFIDGAPAPVAISLSHRAGRALCAVAPAGTALGCDLELIEPREPSFAADYFNEAELALLSAVPTEAQARLCTLIWSAKECALKALGEGLRLDTRDVAIALPRCAETRGWRPVSAAGPAGSRFSGFWRERGGLTQVLLCDREAGPPEEMTI